MNSLSKPNIYFGIGICSTAKLSSGVPFDILDLFLTSEKLRRERQGHVFVHLADSPALFNGFTPTDAAIVTATYQKILSQIIQALNLTNHTLVKASDIISDFAYQKILTECTSIREDYTRLEVADIVWYEQEKQVGYKLGWRAPHTIEDSAPGQGEDYFDTLAIKYGSHMQFIYRPAGRTIHAKREFVPPYVSIDNEDRLVLGETEKKKFDKLKWRDNERRASYFNYLENIVSVFEQLIQPLNGSLEEKVRHIDHLISKK